MNLQNKSVLFLGSSVTRGTEFISFADFMTEKLGLNSVKEAVSGTHLADITEQSYVARLKRIDKNINFDLCICQLSTNDTHPDIPLKKTEDAIRFILEYIKNTFGCPVVFFTNVYYENEKYPKMIEMLYELQKEYEFYILDLFNDEKMCSITKQDRAEYMIDKVHPTIKGYKELWTPKFIEFFENL